jgi:hypothetical protein
MTNRFITDRDSGTCSSKIDSQVVVIESMIIKIPRDISGSHLGHSKVKYRGFHDPLASASLSTGLRI